MSAAAPSPSAPAGAGRRRRSPYQGLVPYTEDDAPYFFGRDTWRSVIVENLVAYRLTIFYGESGVGKSSVLHAGVVPDLAAAALRRVAAGRSPELLPVAFGGSGAWRLDPVGGLKDAVAAAAAAFAPGAAVDRRLPLADVLDACADATDALLLVILDQFDEYLAYHPDPRRSAFDDELAATLSRRDVAANFLVSIREDAVARLDRYEGRIPDLLENLLRIDHLDRASAEEAIVGPLDRWAELEGERIGIDTALVETVLDQVRTGRVVVGDTGRGIAAVEDDDDARGYVEAPYLQLVMTRLWDEDRASGRLRSATLDRLRGAEAIVATHLDKTMRALPRRERALAARMFTYLVTPDGRKIALPPGALAKWTGSDVDRVRPVLAKLAGGDERVLRTVRGESPDAADPSYEIFHDRLGAAILDWRRRYFQRRTRRRIAIVAAAVVAAAVAAVAAGAYAINREATGDLREEIELREKGLRLTIATPDHDEFQAAVFSPDGRWILGVTGRDTITVWDAQGAEVASSSFPAADAAFSPDGRRVAAAGPARVEVADTATLQQVQVIRLPSSQVSFDGTGRLLLLLGDDGFASVWNRAGRRARRAPVAATAAAFDAGARNVFLTGEDGALRSWDLRNGRVTAVIEPQGAPLRVVAAAAGGELVAAAGTDGIVRVLNRQNRQVAALRHGVEITALAFGPTSSVVAVGTANGRTLVWAARAKRRIVEYPRQSGAVTSVAFSPDGERLLTGGADGHARVWAVPQLADLSVSEPTISITNLGTRTVRVETPIANVGFGSSVRTTLVARFLDERFVQSVAALAPGQETVVRFELRVPQEAAPGRYTVELVLDPNGVVSEIENGAPNERSEEITLPAVADGTTTETVTVRPAPTTVEARETVTIVEPTTVTVEPPTVTVTVTERVPG